MRAASIVAAVLLTLCASAALHAAGACDRPAAVCEDAAAGALALIDARKPVAVVADAHDFSGVLRAARDLRSDLSAVAGEEAVFTTAASAQSTVIIVGTLGHSPRIDRIVRAQRIDTRGVSGRWEGFLLQVVERPEPGIARALLIVGADKRGTIFGIYELSRRIGVSPWSWWADVPVQTRTSLHVAPGRFVDAPVVRYRGIFLNDEDPALGGWLRATYGGADHRFYARVFELILRLKGNLLWPAMWGRAFADDDRASPALADEYGVVIGTSHHEPMMRAHVEWKRYGNGAWDYAVNADALRAFWRRGIERMGANESLVTIGMRGDGDEPMARDTAIGLLERIVAEQRRIIADVTHRAPERTPQVWALYKEVQDYFDAGMRVPDDVTLLFSDDNWGNLRRLPQQDEKRPGGYGIYYHFDYVGGPRSYKWINTNPLERVWDQLQLAHAYGAERLWIANVGDLKPMELPISFFLDVAWNPEAMRPERLRSYAAEWSAQQFGTAHAPQIGEILTRYAQYNARRKPELLSPDTYSLINFHEAERVVAEWDALVGRVSRIDEELPAAWHDAYFELVAYPVLASANLTALHVAVARNRLYATQGRVSANAHAVEARRLFARDAELARIYEQDIAGGKWIHMMAQTHIGYTSWRDPETNVLPELRSVDVPAKAAMGVAVEGDARAWPGTAGAPALPVLDPLEATSREIDVFNRGGSAFRFTTQSSDPWLRVTPASGTLGEDTRLSVAVDWTALPANARRGEVVLRGSEGTTVRVAVPLARPSSGAAATQASSPRFVENDGHIAIEAEHFTRAVPAPDIEWHVIPNLGRTLSGVTSWPATAPSGQAGGDGARLEYAIELQQAGEVEIRVVLSPSLDFQHRGGQRYAVSVGDATPQVVTLHADPTPDSAGFAAWNRMVSDNAAVGTSWHRVDRAGVYALKLWRVDPGVVFQRIELWRGAPRDSYLGPPESARR